LLAQPYVAGTIFKLAFDKLVKAALVEVGKKAAGETVEVVKSLAGMIRQKSKKNERSGAIAI
jgi:hypothetical protein